MIFLPFILAAGIAAAAGTGAMVYEHEKHVTAPPPVVATPLPRPAPPKKTITAGPRPSHTYSPLVVKPPKNVAAPEPTFTTPGAPLIPSQEEMQAHAPAPREVLPPLVEPELPQVAGSKPAGSGFLSLLWHDLLYSVIILGALGIIVSAGRKVYSVYKSSTPVTAASKGPASA